jgi:hypothetical protein
MTNLIYEVVLMLKKNRTRAIAFSTCVMLMGLVYTTQACAARNANTAQDSIAQNPAVQPEKKPEQKVPCTLHRDQGPQIGGLRLGLTVDQVLALFPGSKEDAELRAAVTRPPSPFGVSNFMIKPDRYATKAKFEGIREIVVTLLDGRVTGFTANYLSANWKHVDEFVTKFTTGSNLPGVDSWEAYSGLDTQQKSLKCDGFEVTLFAGGEALNANYVKMQDLKAAQELKERRAKAKQNKAKP